MTLINFYACFAGLKPPRKIPAIEMVLPWITKSCFLMVIKSAACFAMPSVFDPDWCIGSIWRYDTWVKMVSLSTLQLSQLNWVELEVRSILIYVAISCPMYTREFQTPVFSSSWDAGFSMLEICSHSCWLESQSMLSIGVWQIWEEMLPIHLARNTRGLLFFSGKQIHWSSILQRSYRLQDAAEETEDTKDSSEMVTEAPSDEELVTEAPSGEELVTEAPSDEELVTEAPSGDNEAGIRLPFGIWTCS